MRSVLPRLAGKDRASPEPSPARLAYRAAALGKDDAIALSSGKFALSIVVGKPEETMRGEADSICSI
jgi:hypothetical protein